MKIITYKPGEDIYQSYTKNNYCQFYWNDTKLWYKGYRKNNKYIGYSEVYRVWRNKGLKYRI